MIEISRRSFITGLATLIAAPAIVRASSLMPVRSTKILAFTEIYNNRVIRMYMDVGAIREWTREVSARITLALNMPEGSIKVVPNNIDGWATLRQS